MSARKTILMSASRRAIIRNRAALTTLVDNIAALNHPDGVIKHPYFDERFAVNSAGIREMKHKFCEAIMLLMESNGHIVTLIVKKTK